MISQNSPDRLDPIMTIDSAFFWKAADEERFVAQKCASCGRLWHPPRAMCPACHSTDKTEQVLAGTGKVISWIMPLQPAAIGFLSPPIIALVEVDEGLRFVTNIEGVAPDKMANGLAVRVGFARTRGGHNVPIFRAEGGR